jgi:hypothetical protein
MRRIAIRISYVAIPVLAIISFMYVQHQIDDLAPAPPVAVPSQSLPAESANTPQQPTILAPEDAAAAPLPNAEQTTWANSSVIQANYELVMPAAEPDVRTANLLDDDFFDSESEQLRR